MDDCLFCRIAGGSIPARIVFEDEDVVAFADVSPKAPVHVLVIPRRHITSVAALAAEDDALAGKVLRTAGEVARRHHLEDGGFRVVSNHGPDAGQSVDHLHIHLLGGRSLTWPPG